MHRYFAGKNVHFAAVGAHHQTALFVHINGFACTLPAVRQVEGDPAAQIDAGGLVFLPEGCKAIAGKHIHVAVKAKVGQALGQPCGVGGKIHLCALQRQRGAVGQTGGIKVALRLGQIDADAAQNAPALLLVAVAHALAQDAHDLFAVEQKVVGPLDLAVHAVAQLELGAHGKACQQRQGGRLGQRFPDGCCIIQGLALGVHPAAAKAAPACGLVLGIHRTHRAELFKMFLHVSVGAAAFRQIAHLIDAHCLGTSLCS